MFPFFTGVNYKVKYTSEIFWSWAYGIQKIFQKPLKKFLNSKMSKNEYSPTLSSLDLRVDFENPRFVDVSLNIFRLVRPMFLIFFYWRKLQGQTHLLDTLIMGVWRTENFLQSFEKLSNSKNEYSFPWTFIVRYVGYFDIFCAPHTHNQSIQEVHLTLKFTPIKKLGT